MTKVTSITLHKTNLGNQMAITYSEIGEDGTVIAQNKRAESVIMDSRMEDVVAELYDFAKNFIENR